jgi:hypothetical protein
VEGLRYETLINFMNSGDAAWDITDTDMDATSVIDFLSTYPDILYVYSGLRRYLINRDKLGKPKVLTNGDTGDDNGTA